MLKSHDTTQRRFTVALVLSCLLLVPACTDPQTYPVGGEECGPADPVQTMDAQDCMPPV